MLLKAIGHCPPHAHGRRPEMFTKTIRIMKLVGLCMLGAIFHLSAATRAQTVTYAAKGVPLVQVLDVLERQTGYSFFYDKQDLRDALPVTVQLQKTPLDKALDAILLGQPLTYRIHDNTIVLTKKDKPTPVQPSATSPPPGDIHGRVTDTAGAPLSGASVAIKNKRIGTTTNAKGEFTLKNVEAGATLVVSYTGYVSQEVKLDARGDFSINLVRSTSRLDAVQVIPYGITTPRLNTGNVTTVTSKEIEEQPVSNVLAAIEGRVPGLIITQATGVPGGGFTVQIRGQNSIFNGNDPFYVVDGVPYSSEMPGNLLNGVLHSGNPLNFINPYDIESVEVLKDADATAIYGSRAANGAILITTKKGKTGNMKFDLNIRSGFTSPDRDISLMNTKQYLAMRHEAFKNDGATAGPSDHDINGDWDTTRYTNWSKVLTQNTAHFADAEASVSGGNLNTQYLIGAGYNLQTTGFPNLTSSPGGDRKVSMHFNINSSSLDKKFKLTFSGSYLSDQNTVQSEDFSMDRFYLSPDAPPLFNADGTLNWAPTSPGLVGTWSNPYASLYIGYKGLTSNLVSNAILSYTILPGLEIKTSIGYTNIQTDEIQTLPTTYFDPGTHPSTGVSHFNTMNSHSWIVEPQLNYKLKLGRGLLSALVGGSFHENKSSVQGIYATGFVSDALLENVQDAAKVYTNSNSSQYKYDAVFGRLNYNWEDKYLLNITARRDGSSRFGPSKQFGNFGAIGAGWIFTGEDFVKENLRLLSFGKIRASYGNTGNDQVGDYKFLNLYNATSYPYGNSQGLYPVSLFNPNLAWEIDKKLEAGIELGFFKDRLTIQASAYENRSNNQLVTTPVSEVTGFTNIPSNLPAQVQNAGEEFVISGVIIKSKNFDWTSSLNISMSRNKLVSFPNLASSGYPNYIIGQPLNIVRVLHFAGVNDTTGLYQFATGKNGTTYSPTYPDDFTSLINTNPKYYGGCRNSFRYKGFSLDIFFQFVRQTGQNIYGAYQTMPGIMNNQPATYLNRWQKPGDIKPYQQFSQNNSGNAYNQWYDALYSDYAYSDASFIRLKNLAVSWRLPDKWKQKMHLENCRIYVQGQNLLTITHYNGIDPESQGTGLPPARIWTAGLQIRL